MARPKVILNMYPMLPAKDEEERKQLRPLGRNAELYHEAVHGWIDILKAAEDLGVWGAATIEHHLHSEGYEVSPNPGILNAWWAGQFKKLNVGALGYVMATQDPIRVAEETAILSHITKGRSFVGLARGYQSRWANILGQTYGSVATSSDGGADDQKNREMFEERVDMLLKCWGEDSLELDGKYYQAPFPLETGVQGYPAREIARTAGALGEIDESGAVRRISVVPKPYQWPKRPPVLVATSKSDESVRYAARHGFIPTYFSKFTNIAHQGKIYIEEGKKYGHDYKPGQLQNIVRYPHIGRDSADVRDRMQRYDVDIYKNFYTRFFPHFSTDSDTDWVQNALESDLYTVGTASEMRAQWEKMYESVPAEYITLIYHYAQQPKEEIIEEVEQFMTQVWPHLDGATSD